MNFSPTDPELLRLFAMKADGTITPEDHEKLCVLLTESPEARREWFAFQDAEDALQSWAQRATLIQSSAPAQTAAATTAKTSKARPQRGVAWRITAAMAAGIVIGAVTWAVWPQPAAPSISPSGSNLVIQDEATTSAVAVLTRGVDLVWEGTGATPSLHEPLSPGELKLRSGVAEIEFFQGARLRIEGPAELKLISAGEAYCKSGRFSADVPFHARGFRISTPKGDLVDLGTEFGLDLNSDTPALHVFKGEVELHRPKTAMQLLTTGQAARMEGSDTMSADDTGFAFSRDLDSRVQASQRQSFDAWQQTSAQQLRDPALLLRLDFQDGAGARSLKNAAPQGPDIAAGTIVGCTWTQGRWPGTGKQALQFRSLSDRVRLNIPGQYRQLTAIASVQLNGLNIRQSSICMTQGLGMGYMHWQVLHDGSLCLGVGEGPGRPGQGVPVRWQDYISPVLFTPERFGQWVHLAMVYDLDAREVRFYVNGTRFSTHPIKEAVQLSPGLVELGNWTPTPDKRQQPVRNFNGCMDEFSMISRALGDAEIRQFAR
jgi:hypothetical protein